MLRNQPLCAPSGLTPPPPPTPPSPPPPYPLPRPHTARASASPPSVGPHALPKLPAPHPRPEPHAPLATSRRAHLLVEEVELLLLLPPFGLLERVPLRLPPGAVSAQRL